MIELFDTASRTKKPLAPRTPGKVSMYVCGPTVYGPPHLGHGRFSLVFDVLRRYLVWNGLDVTYVSNVTDIDDNIIKGATAAGEDFNEFAQNWERIWWEAMDGLSVLRPDNTPHATEYVDQMVATIASLIDTGAAYVTSDGVYMAVRSVQDYGLLAHQSLEDLVEGAGERTLVGEEKRATGDFVLWKLAKPGEPAWPSPWGDGRRGWHTECVVMSLDILGDAFDIHGGGIDLAFPHHENERAQAVALGRESAALWVHNGFVEVGGEKMSKSLGNFSTLTDLIEQHDPRAYRLLVLQSHYRSPVEVTPASITNAEAALARLDNFADRAAEAPGGAPNQDLLEEFRNRMDDDLDTPGAMAAMFSGVTEANRMLDAGEAEQAAPNIAAVLEMLTAVGLKVGRDLAEVPADVLELCARRDAARTDREWAAADDLRDQLVAMGWIVEDSPTGTKVRKS